MFETKIKTSNALQVNTDLDMNGNKAKNLHDGELVKDAVTKQQLDATADELAEQNQWKATQW